MAGNLIQRDADPSNRISRISRAWEGRTVVCIATGPSLTQDQVNRVALADVKTIVVNDAYLLAPWAEVSYFADLKWWKWHTDGIAKPLLGLTAADVKQRFADFSGQKCSIQHWGKEAIGADVHLLNNGGNEGISTDPASIKTGRNSGYQALNIAVLSGASRIVLLGYDGKFSNGRAHFFGDHPEREGEGVVIDYSRYYRTVENPLKELGIEVLNASPGNAIPHFRTVDLDQVLRSASVNEICETT